MKATDLIVVAGAAAGVALALAGLLYLITPVRERVTLPVLAEARPVVVAPMLLVSGLLLIVLSLGVFAD